MSFLYFLCFALQTILESVEEKAAFTISLNIFVLRAHREPEDLNSGNYGINRLALLAISYSFQSFYLRFFAGSSSVRLQGNVAALVSALGYSNRPNQDHFIREGAVTPLVKLLRSKDSRCQLKAARALQALAEDNEYAQEEIDKCDAGKPLIRLLKLWDVNMKEQGIFAFLALI